MAEINQRTVYGRDRVVTYNEKTDTVSVRYIQAHQGDRGRFSPELLLKTLGINEEAATMQFVMNNNLHNDGKGCRGAVLLVNLCIGMIVQSVGTFILFRVLCPRRLSGFKVIQRSILLVLPTTNSGSLHWCSHFPPLWFKTPPNRSA